MYLTITSLLCVCGPKGHGCRYNTHAAGAWTHKIHARKVAKKQACVRCHRQLPTGFQKQLEQAGRHDGRGGAILAVVGGRFGRVEVGGGNKVLREVVLIVPGTKKEKEAGVPENQS